MKRLAMLLLLALPTCGSFPRQYAQADGTTVIVTLPDFPRWVPGKDDTRVPVRLVHLLRCNGYKARGCFSPAARTISIEDTLTTWSRWLVLRHEIAHLAIHDADLVLPNALEDSLADAMAMQAGREWVAGWPR